MFMSNLSDLIDPSDLSNFNLSNLSDLSNFSLNNLNDLSNLCDLSDLVICTGVGHKTLLCFL